MSYKLEQSYWRNTTPGASDPRPQKPYPTDNYLSGNGKSHVWMGQQWYVPSERDWIKHHDYRSLPRATKRDAIDMQSEDQWVEFMRQRDTPSGYYHKNIGTLPSGVPEVRLFGYTRNLPSMPPKDIFQNPWPKADQWTPIERHGRGEYYGYYHQTMEAERDQRMKELPTSMKINPRDVPKIL